MTKSPGDNSSSKGKQGSLRNAAIRNVISEHPSPNLRKTLLAIPIILAPVIQNRASPISPAEAAGPTNHQRGGFQMKPTKAERQTGNAPAAPVETTNHTFVPNTARRTHLNRTPAIAAAAMTANKSNTKTHSTRSREWTKLALIKLAEATESYMVEVIAESHHYKQQLISCRFSTCLLPWQGKEVRYSWNSPTCAWP